MPRTREVAVLLCHKAILPTCPLRLYKGPNNNYDYKLVVDKLLRVNLAPCLRSKAINR